MNSEFEHLVATWSEHPTGTACAAAADGLRKRGALAEAEALATECLLRWPEFLPGLLVQARVRRDGGDLLGAERALLAALATDPAHPVVLRELADLAELRGQPIDGRAWRKLGDAAAEPPLPGMPGFLAGPALQPSAAHDLAAEVAIDEEPGEPGEEVLTESLAALYQAQGHLGRAAEVYAVLADRTPQNPVLAERRDALRDHLNHQHQRPFDARLSGGEALGDWLRQLALDRPQGRQAPQTGYDAFYRALPPREAPENFEAFQNWLKGLGR